MRPKLLLIISMVLIPGWCLLTNAAAALELRHELTLRIIPSEQRLVAVDHLSLHGQAPDRLVLSLSPKAKVTQAYVNGQPVAVNFSNGRLDLDIDGPVSEEPLQASVHYTVVFDDDVPVQPLNTDNPGYGVAGTISEQGCFLLAGSGWYPSGDGVQSHFRIKVLAPQGWLAVTAGSLIRHAERDAYTVSQWQVDQPLKGLALSAGPYHLQTRQEGALTAAVYLFADSTHLADAYLTAVLHYLRLYTDLFGPYPFDHFAVVENFFPTGYGFPSYTLLGSSVIRLPFIIETSLGHEIAHCWWGNGVLVDHDQGNWSEGLTTYVADYYYKEMQSSDAAREYRLQMLRNYAVLVGSGQDMPLSRFQSRFDPATKAIGYDKGAMVFHMLRRRLGDEIFWSGLKAIYTQKRFQPTSWRDLQVLLEHHSGQDLNYFFEQWVFRQGAPALSLADVERRDGPNGPQVSGVLVQSEPSYRGNVDLVFRSGTQEQHHTLQIEGARTPFTLTPGFAPEQLVVDGNVDWFRRLWSVEIPPTVNALRGASGVTVVLAGPQSARLKAAGQLMVRAFGLSDYRVIKEAELQSADLQQRHVLVIGPPGPKTPLQKALNGVVVNEDGFRHAGRVYRKPTDSFFSVLRHPASEKRVLAFFLPPVPNATEQVVRKIPHYGKYSYLIFQDGRNTGKGTWPVEASPLIHTWKEPAASFSAPGHLAANQ